MYTGAYASPMAKRSAGRQRGNAIASSVRLSPSRSPRLLANTWSFPLAVGLVHLLIVQITASLAYAYGTPTSPSNPRDHPFQPLGGLVGKIVNPMQLWDGLWYRLIAEEGYQRWEAKAAFWPFFPWLMRGVHTLTGLSYETAGYLIANICFLIALVLLYQLILSDFEAPVAAGAVIAIAVFPTAFFFNVVYTESPFLMLTVAGLLCARTGKWWWAGVFGALAALTRSYGVFLILPYAVLFWDQYGATIRRRITPEVLAVGMPILGPAIFSWWLRRIWGNWLLWKDVQEQWARYSAKPWQTLTWAFQERSPTNTAHHRTSSGLGGDGAEWRWLHQLFSEHSWSLISSGSWRLDVANSDTLELVCTLLFIVLAIVGLRVLPLYQSVFLIPGLLVPLFQPSYVHTLMSMPRFGLTLFPIFVVLAIIVPRLRLTIPAVIVSTVLLVLLTIQFSTWYWVS